jgi:hypothetical protein
LAALTAKGSGQVSALPALQQDDNDQKETDCDVKNRDQNNHAL